MSYPGQFGQYSGESNPPTPVTYSQWDSAMPNEPQLEAESSQQQQQQEQQQQHLQRRQHQQPSEPSPPPHAPQQNPTETLLQLELIPRVVPPQQGTGFDDTPIHLQPVPQRRESLRNSDRLHLETASVGPTRRSSHRQHHQQAHPYHRPPSAMNPAPPSRQHGVRFSSAQPSSSMQASSSGMTSPAVPLTAMPSPAIPSPTSITSRLGSYGSAMGSPVETLLVPPVRGRGREERRQKYMLRMDSWYDSQAKVLRVMLEVPGVNKRDLKVTLSTCSWNRVKHVTVTGVVRPAFPSSSAGESAEGTLLEFTTIRERKFGEFARTFAVPAETNRDELEVNLEAGILFINVPCGPPVAPNPEDVPIH